MATLSLRNLEKKYANGHHAVKGVSLDIADGEFVVLVGPSGCGKSTVLRMIAGLEEISDGTIAIDGRVVNNLEPKDRDIAMVFQNYALYPHMTVAKNMGFALSLRGMSADDVRAKVQSAAKSLGIDELLDRKPGQLSGGQRQRVAVGRAIVRDPKVALFDEPLSNLDAKLRVATRGELKALHQRLGTTTIYVTHDQEEAMTLGDRIVVMRDGVVQQHGTPMEVYNRPANRFVAGFIGMPPMNFLEGSIEQGRLGPAFASGALRIPLAADAPRPDNLGALVLGFRPHAVEVGVPDGWPAVIEVVEPHGDVTDLTLLVDRRKIVVRSRGMTPAQPGTTLMLRPLLPEVRWFEPGEAGQAI